MSAPRSIAGTVNGTQQATYTLPGGVFQFVQSIRAVIDNTAGADCHPNLSIADASGAVIADAPQNGIIPAGEADGAATWALRLADEGGASAGQGSEGLSLGVELNSGLDSALASWSGAIGKLSGSLSGAVGLALTWNVPANSLIVVSAANLGSTPLNIGVGTSQIQTIGATTRERFQGLSIPLPADASTNVLPINFHAADSTIINKTVPLAPRIINAGTYAATFNLFWFP